MADANGRERHHARRSSFRKTLADHAESGLPSEYLDQLEQKRKQLDESIHKYIAAKEREYRNFERDLKLQHKQTQEKDKESAKLRRASSEAAAAARQDHNGQESPRIPGKQQVVDQLVAAGLRRDQLGQPVAVAVVDDENTSPTLETSKLDSSKTAAGLTDRRASLERDKEFVGVFTPAFLPALDNKAPNNAHAHAPSERASSAPPEANTTPDRNTADLPRAESEPIVGAKPKRPAELSFIHRNSSSGSSTEGKLASALKSPTQPARAKRKRVSIAVGDVIVAPSDNVPHEMSSNNSTPSHSRARSPASDRDQSPLANTSAPRISEPETLPPPMVDPKPVQNGMIVEKSPLSPATETVAPALPAPASSSLDPDGDLFDLQDDEDDRRVPTSDEDHSESGDEITGRIHRNVAVDDEVYDPEAGLVDGNDNPGDHAEHVEFIPGSAVASQQPTNPGFRRPSATFDPVYRGANYESAEHSAVVNDIYGSSYSRPNKGSFNAGSLGESFMAQNAERMMRDRGAREQPQVRS